MTVVNIVNSKDNKHRIQIDEEYLEDVMKLIQRKAFKISTYFDMVLIQDFEMMLAVIFQIKQKGSSLIAVEYGCFNWFWTSTRKLIGFSPARNTFKIIDTLKKNNKASLEVEAVP
jgi:2C-methyl-D-erythritol 2,4-cyclodiphosphate synthase